MALMGYFDDTGTHKGSPLVAWAGFLGFTPQWNSLENRWIDELGARGLDNFHMSECESGNGSYGSRAARDSLTHDLRKVILDERLIGCGSGGFTHSFERAPAWVHRVFQSAAQLSAYMCVRDALDIAVKAGFDPWNEPISFFFDGGAKTAADFESAVDLFRDHMGRVDAVTRISVSGSPALQAADMFGWEVRNYFLELDKDPTTKPRAHFQHFMDAERFEFSLLTDATVEAWHRKGPPPSLTSFAE